MEDVRESVADGSVAGAAPRGRAGKRWWFVPALVLMVVLLLLLAAELASRAFWTPPEALNVFVTPSLCRAPEPGAWELLPDLDISYRRAELAAATTDARDLEDDDTEIRVVTDSLGMRGAGPGERRPDELRLLMVGDSMMFGHGMAQDECFAELAGSALRRRLGRPVTVCNAGVPGYGMAAAMKRLRRLQPRLQADVVVASMCLGNDFTDDIEQRRVEVLGGRAFTGAMAHGLADSVRARIAVRSRLWLWCEWQLVQHRPDWSLLTLLRMSPEHARASQGMPPPERTVAGLFLDAAEPDRPWPIDRLLTDLHATLRSMRDAADGRPLLLVLLPTWMHVDPACRRRQLESLGFAPQDYPDGAIQRRIRRLCAELRIDVLDTTPTLAAQGDPQGLFLFRGADFLHLSVRGNAIVGALLGDRLAELAR
ncbi:MAG: GDSL-type esterase/lipase family protein [Planctomycetota bacterium]